MSGNFIVAAIVALIIFFAAYSVYKNRRQGKCCGCDSSCPHAGSCQGKGVNR